MMSTQPRIASVTRYTFVAIGLILVGLARTAFATDWEIEPQDDPRFSLGKVSVVGGVLGTDPIVFVLKKITLSTPVQVTLAATDAKQPVEMSVYKESPNKPLVSGTATSDKPLTVRFKTGEPVYFAVKSADGAHYQLFTWIGPEFEIEESSPIIPVAEYPASPPRVEKATTPPAKASPTANQPAGTIVLGAWPSILLGLILLALIAIVILLWRRGSRSGAALLLLLFLAHGSVAADEKGVPNRVTPKDEAPPVKKNVSDLTKLLDTIIKGAEGKDFEGGTYKPKEREPGVIFVKDPSKDITYTIKTEKEVEEKPGSGPKIKKFVGDSAALLKFTLGLLEEFGYIDPREAAIQKNMNPPGMPLLPSRCAKDPECGPCFKKANKDLMEARSLLETQYVIYKQTELATGRIIELGDAAAGMSSIAKFVWDQEKHGTTVTAAQEKFYGQYDSNLEKLLRNVNDALIAQAGCERNAFGDQDWYNRYGWLYYSFLRDRYTRK
jgi:hypothetical protein